jgi:hypothetical protein
MLPDDAIFHDFVQEVREARMNARQRAADVA